MKVKCMKCGFTYERKVSWEGICLKCGCSRWVMSLENSGKLFNKTEKKIDDLYKATLDFVVREWLKENGYIITEKMGVPTMMEATMKAREKAEKTMNKIDPFHYRKKCKEEGLAFEIFQIEDGNKIKNRKIYLNGHIEGFKGNPCIVNHIAPKIMAFKCLLKQMNKDYRDFIERHLLADLPIDPIELSKLYQAQLERIENIKI